MKTKVDLVDAFIQSGHINLTAHISAFGCRNLQLQYNSYPWQC